MVIVGQYDLVFYSHLWSVLKVNHDTIEIYDSRCVKLPIWHIQNRNLLLMLKLYKIGHSSVYATCKIKDKPPKKFKQQMTEKTWKLNRMSVTKGAKTILVTHADAESPNSLSYLLKN